MTRSTTIWLHGLIAAIVSGLANGAINGFVAMGIAPDRFNLQAQFLNTLEMAAISGVFGAVLGLALFLKQSPLPPEREVWTEEQRQQKAAGAP